MIYPDNRKALTNIKYIFRLIHKKRIWIHPKLFVQKSLFKIRMVYNVNIGYVYSVPHFVGEGETLLSYERSVYVGGKGLN